MKDLPSTAYHLTCSTVFMAQEGDGNHEKPGAASGYGSLGPRLISKRRDMILILLRFMALLATTSGTIVMALNRETKTFVVGTIGTTPIKATLTAKFQHTPANIFFVVANGWATLHNMLMLVIETYGRDLDFKGLRCVAIASLDTMIFALVAAGASSAAFIAEIAKNGNSHAAWNKICDKFETFCHHGGAAIIASFVGLALLSAISVISNFKLQKQKTTVGSVDAM
ncbi:hypothetical protein Nepgr_022830 [Nepenthes gracilis]|uniref:CASP-like protein n=1 Tax=Nepenthes gracilis TaxID=150966 RepID=A0AAD3SZS7_NEPGR|nr:hypothetical protein Nepgr_022830 [Nepenthes gracilis]